MYQRILVPTDGSPLSRKAAETAASLAKMTGGTLVALSVCEPFPYSAISEINPLPPQSFIDAQLKLAQERVREIQQVARDAGLPCEGLTIEADHPWEAVLKTAEDQRCDLIVMASHGRRGVAALLLGSETHKVLTHGKLPVLVVR